MPWWSVYVEAEGNDPALVTDEAIGQFVTALVQHSGVAAGGGGHPSWGARLSVQAATAVEAVVLADSVVTSLAARSGLPAWPAVRAEAVREDVFDAELGCAR